MTDDIRRIRTYGNGPSLEVRDVLQAVFVADLLEPSESIWLVSPWVSDIPVVDNRDGAFSSMGVDWGHREVLLSEALPVVLDAGTRVTVVLRGGDENLAFRTRLRRLMDAYARTLRMLEFTDVHEKGLVTDHATVGGSMNFTYSGTSSNLESLVLDVNPERINQLQLELSQQYPWEQP